MRHQIAASVVPAGAPRCARPQGLARLSQIWTAPFARYAPPYIRSAAFGYLLSAMFGAGLVMLACLRGAAVRPQSAGYDEAARRRADLSNAPSRDCMQAMERALHAEHSAAGGGLLQSLDARVKVPGFFR